MELSKKDRFILINQFLILEKLYPDEADYYEKHRVALQQGFALHYKWILENVWNDLSEADCLSVLNALTVYRAIVHSFDKLEAKHDLTEERVRFPGFDGNEESQHLAYARYFIVDLGRFEELRRGQEYPDFNSPVPMLDTYSRMHEKWESWGRPLSMSYEKINDLLAA